MRLALLAFLLAPAALAGGAPSDAAVPAAAASPDDAARARAQAAAKQLGGTLKARVMEEMGKGGPVGAVSVCVDEAGAIEARIEGETGADVGRSSLRLRNPANAAPDWVRAWLTEQGERKAEGVRGIDTVVDGKARFLAPIAIEAPCLACHGAPEAIAPDVRAKIAALRPGDAATGYALGDLRGALWAEVPVGR